MSENLHEKPLGPAFWRAGAGAGKTYNLVKRVMRIAEEWGKSRKAGPSELPRLVVTTFTRMATQELRVRLMEAALEAAAKGNTELVPFVTSRSHLFVTTMHGVMDAYLRSFGSALGLEAGFRVGGNEEIQALVRRVGKEVLFPRGGITDEAKRDAVDRLLIESDFSRALTLLRHVSRVRQEFPEARAVSREEIAASIRSGVQSCLRPVSDLRAEVENAIESAAQEEKWKPYLEWLRDLEKHAASIAMELDELEMLLELLRSKPSVTNSGKAKIEFAAGKDWKAPLDDFSEMLERTLAEVAALDDFDSLNQSLAFLEVEFSRELRQEKIRTGLIEIEDLELLALELVREHPQTATTFAEGWDHWLIDEYQDTSPRQVLLIEALSQTKPQFVVGDPQQSIYLFRGARPNVFHDKETAAEAARNERVILDRNRRSHPEVMRFINGAVAELGTDFESMVAERENMENVGRRPKSVASPFGPAVFLALEPLTREEGGKIKKEKIDALREFEADQVALAIARLLEVGASPASISVLARTYKELSAITRGLNRARVPYQAHISGAFSDRLEISDLCAFLSFLSNPHDDDNLIHLARTPWFPIDENVLAKGYRRTDSLWSVIENEPEAEILRTALFAARERGVVQAFRETLVSCDFFTWCGILDPSGRREANALKFLTRLAIAERQAGFVPRRFVDEVIGGGDHNVGGDSGGESSDRDAVAAVKPDRVHVMTIHASKGLEFDHVFLPFIGEKPTAEKVPTGFVFHEQKKVWSAGLALGDEGKLSTGPLGRDWTAVLTEWKTEEFRRVFYVAMTRARESIFLSSTGSSEKSSFRSFLSLRDEAGDFSLGGLGGELRGERGRYRVMKTIDGEAKLATLGPADNAIRKPYGSVQHDPKSVMSSISVTRLLELEDEEADQKVGRVRLDNADRARRSLKMAELAARGTRLHRVFELAKPDASRPAGEGAELLAGEIARWFKNDESGDDQTAAREALQWLLTLKEPNLNAVLVNGEVEWGFAYRRPDEKRGLTFAVEGQIDLWGRDDQGVLWVIDYKTGDSSYKEKALRQLRYYAEALRAAGIMKPGETAKLAALYPFSKEVFTSDLVL